MKVKSESEVAQSCPTLRDPMDCSPPGSPVHGILQARVLEWGAVAHHKYVPLEGRKLFPLLGLLDPVLTTRFIFFLIFYFFFNFKIFNSYMRSQT